MAIRTSNRSPFRVERPTRDGPAGRRCHGLCHRRPIADGVNSQLLATATTGPDGRFVARGVELTVWKPDPSPLPGAEEGRFQVAATAPGFGFTWHEIVGYRPGERPHAAAAARPAANEVDTFYQGEPIAIDLAFGPAASLHGKLVDDRGRPLAGVKVQVGVIDYTRRPNGGKMWSCVRVDPTDTVPRERRAFDGVHAMPDDILSTRTGADGTYRIDGLPRETEFLTLIDPGPEYDPMEDDHRHDHQGQSRTSGASATMACWITPS